RRARTREARPALHISAHPGVVGGPPRRHHCTILRETAINQSALRSSGPEHSEELAPMALTSLTGEELATQPANWRRAAALAAESAPALPQRGERVAVIGCGTSWFMAQAYAALRETGGHGETDALAASEFPPGR